MQSADEEDEDAATGLLLTFPPGYIMPTKVQVGMQTCAPGNCRMPAKLHCCGSAVSVPCAC